jgi:Fuc2NAc and GlcNAc transferase
LILVTALSGEGKADLSALGLGVATSGFLWFNLPRARIFMGDAGSYFIAFAMAVCGLLQVQRFGLDWWALLILPGTFVVDSITTLSGRLLARAVWYHPHNTHAYQLLAARWNSHSLVVMCNACVNLLWLLPMALLATRQPALGPILLIVAWLPLVAVVVVVRRKHA